MDDWLTRNRVYLATLVLFILVLVGTVFFLRRPEPVTLVMTTATPRPTPTVALLMVDVRGAVANPGVYTLPVGSRVQDVLVAAGNPAGNADTSHLNLARKLNDGEQIHVPTLGEAIATSPPAAVRGERQPTPTRTPPGKININTATLEELDLLPGIGPALGQRILDYRNQYGPFQQLEDLKKVRGIGDALFGGFKDLIVLQ